jgi:plastocyanin
VNANTSVTRTFETAGTFTYTCHIHPDMHGKVVVQ